MRKRIVIIIMVCLFAFMGAGVCQSGIYSNQTNNSETSSRYGSLYGNHSENSTDGATYGALYRSSTSDDLGGRPGNGGAIGQEMPIGGGFGVFISCGVAFCLGKYFRRRRKGVNL